MFQKINDDSMNVWSTYGIIFVGMLSFHEIWRELILKYLSKPRSSQNAQIASRFNYIDDWRFSGWILAVYFYPRLYFWLHVYISIYITIFCIKVH